MTFPDIISNLVFFLQIYLLVASFQTMGDQIEANQAKTGSPQVRRKHSNRPTFGFSPVTYILPSHQQSPKYYLKGRMQKQPNWEIHLTKSDKIHFWTKQNTCENTVLENTVSSLSSKSQGSLLKKTVTKSEMFESCTGENAANGSRFPMISLLLGKYWV